jgi:hypothetical protein
VAHLLRQISGALGEAHAPRTRPSRREAIERRGLRSAPCSATWPRSRFRLARDLEAPQRRPSVRPVAITGTPLYMSPDRCRVSRSTGAATCMRGSVGYFC